MSNLCSNFHFEPSPNRFWKFSQRHAVINYSIHWYTSQLLDVELHQRSTSPLYPECYSISRTKVLVRGSVVSLPQRLCSFCEFFTLFIETHKMLLFVLISLECIFLYISYSRFRHLISCYNCVLSFLAFEYLSFVYMSWWQHISYLLLVSSWSDNDALATIL